MMGAWGRHHRLTFSNAGIWFLQIGGCGLRSRGAPECGRAPGALRSECRQAPANSGNKVAECNVCTKQDTFRICSEATGARAMASGYVFLCNFLVQSRRTIGKPRANFVFAICRPGGAT